MAKKIQFSETLCLKTAVIHNENHSVILGLWNTFSLLGAHMLQYSVACISKWIW